MKHTLMFSALLVASQLACAVDAPPKTDPAQGDQTEIRIDAQAKAADAKNAAARAELTELRTQMQALSSRMATLSTELGDVGPRAYAYRYIGQTDRAMIGVVLGRDSDGVRISAVTPDGPAARAGLRDGDVITTIDHRSVAGTDAAASLASAREHLSNLKENQNVAIEYRRGAQKNAATLRAERREAWNWPALMNDDPEHPFLPKDFNERMRADMQRAMADAKRTQLDSKRIKAEAMRAQSEAMRANSVQMRKAMDEARRAMRRGMPWWGINLATVDADLGRYFGTASGALVLSTDADSLPGLRAGDVITRVAGEPVARSEDVMRALRDQPAGKNVPVKLMRDRKTIALDIKAPEFKSIFSVPPTPPEPPLPPTPPTPKVPPAPAAPPAPSDTATKPVVAPVAVPSTAATPAAVAAVPPAPSSDDD